MGIPFSNYITDLALQRRIDTLEAFRFATAHEQERIEQALTKSNFLLYFNRLGFCLFIFTLYKGRLLERGNYHGVSLTRAIVCLFIGTQYLWFGDFLSSCILWGDTKYIYYRYEPLIRRVKFYKNPYAVIDKDLKEWC